MAIKRTDDFYLAAAGSKVEERIEHKFGRNAAVGTTFAPLCFGGVFQTPTSATALEAVSTSANDTAAGSGAQQLTIVGLNSAWAEVTQTVEMNGLTAAALGTDLIRLNRYWASRSGTYATTSSASQAGDLIIRGSGAGPTWATLDSTDYGRAQSEIGCVSIETGKEVYLLGGRFVSESSKSASAIIFRRESADDVTTPFSGTMRVIAEATGFTGAVPIQPKAPYKPIIGPCDIIVLGKLDVGTGSMSVGFNYLQAPS